MEDKVYETIAGLLLRVSALETILIKKGLIDQKEYLSVLEDSLGELQKITQDIVNKKILQ